MGNIPQPPIDIKSIQLKDIFNIEELQHLQDLFSDATGVASIITTPEGIPVTKPSNFCRLCQDIIRKTKIGQQNCYKSDAILGAQNQAGSVIQNCHSCGLWDAGASIIVGGHHIASWLIGQIRNPETSIDQLLNYADEIGADRNKYKEALLEVPVMSADKFKKIAKMLFLYANELSDKAYKNLLLKSKINELEQAMDLVNQSENRFQSLFQQAPLGYQSLDVDGNILEVNQRWIDIIGYEAHEVVGKWFGDFLANGHQEVFSHQFINFKKQGFVHREFDVVTKKGRRLIIAFDGKVGHHHDGTFKQTHCILKDITKQVQAEEALKASDERYKTILKTAMNGFWVVDSKGYIIEVNNSYCTMSGYTEDELIGMHISELDIDENFEDVDTHISNIRKIGEDRFEAFHRRKDGSIFNVEINVQQINSPKSNFLVVFIHDITKRKSIEQKLKQTTQTYIDLFNTISEAIYIQDENGLFIEVNKGAEVLYQLTKDELIGQSPLTVTAPGLNNLEEVGRMSKEVFLTGIPAHFDFWAKRKSGEIFPKNVIVNKGKYFGQDVLIATARDITLQKLDEKTIRESEEKFRMIFDESPIGIELYNADGYQINANQASLNMFGIPDINEIFDFNLFDGTSLDADLRGKLSNGIAVNYQSAFDFSEVQELKQYATHRQGIAHFEYHIKPLFNEETQAISGYLSHITEITKRVEAEKEISLLAHSLESVNECVSITDLNNTLLYVNKAFLKTYGYEKEELIGKNIGMVGSINNSPSYLIEILTATIKRGWLGELVNKTKNGKEFPILLSTTHIKDNQGQTIGLIGVAKDITQRKRHVQELVEAKKKAEESELRFKALHDASFGGITIHDKGLILDCNQGLTEITGYSMDELIGMDGLLLISEKTRDLVMKNILDEYEKPYEAIGLRKDGSEYNLRLEARMIPYRSKQVRAVEFRDITRQKQNEFRIKENEENLKFLFDNMIQGVAYLNSDSEIIYANYAAEKILGLSFEQMNGLSSVDPLWHAIHEDGSDFPGDKHPSIRALKTGKPIYDIKMGVFNPQLNEYNWININAFPRFRDNETSPYQVVTTFQDITDVLNATQELIRAKDKAEESDRLKSAFLANMSHEIRTPMNGILGFTSLLKEPKLKGEDQQKYIDIIEKSGTRMLNIINDIISISKVEAGQMEVFNIDTNINDKIDYLYTFFKPEAEGKSLNLVYNCGLEHHDSVIFTDKEKIIAILTNLIKNAIKFTEQGSIEFGYVKKGEFLEFYVKDTGTGIHENKIDVIFDRFIQGSESLSRNYEGAGLGLAICKAYIKMLGGDIWVESDQNSASAGSSFYFTIPYQPLAIPTKETPSNDFEIQQNTVVKKLKILLAEDDESSQIYTSEILKNITKELIIASNGSEAILLSRDHPDIDLILMDIKMPILDGYQATREIRLENPQVVIIAQTAYALTGDREKALNAGCNDYITKPVNANKLFNLLKKYF